jgi:hypothetical protein
MPIDPNLHDDQLVDLPEIAEMLGVNPSTVRLWVNEGRLPADKQGSRKWYVRVGDLRRMLESQPGIGHARTISPPNTRTSWLDATDPDVDKAGHPSNRVTVSSRAAREQLRVADEHWQFAIRGLEGFPARMRALATAAEDEGRALTMAGWANIAWAPMAGARRLKMPAEIDPGSNRPGPPKLWARFDAAVGELGHALEGDSIDTLASAFGQLRDIALAIAEACEQESAAPPRRMAG